MVGSSDGKRTGEGRDGGTRLASNMLASIDGKTPRRTCLADQLREQAGPQTSRNKHPFVVSKSAPDTRRFRRGCLTTGYHEEERDALTEPRTRFQVFFPTQWFFHREQVHTNVAREEGRESS